MAKNKGKDRQTQKGDIVRLAFYLKCPGCGLIYNGVKMQGPPEEIEIREYPRFCIRDDAPLMPELKLI